MVKMANYACVAFRTVCKTCKGKNATSQRNDPQMTLMYVLRWSILSIFVKSEYSMFATFLKCNTNLCNDFQTMY